MKFAYADPPYLGCAKYYKEHSQAYIWDEPKAHRVLIDFLCQAYPDGWALSASSTSLRTILPMCPEDVRIGAWVKPFAVFKPNVNPAYAWEPVLFRGGRRGDRTRETVRDWIPCVITLKKGLTGAKPPKVCEWILSLLGAQKGDQVDDLFPGTGIFTSVWHNLAA